MTENELFNFGREIKSAFLRKQNDKFQGYKLNKRFDDPKYWIAAARLCDECHLGSDEFVGCVFDYLERRQYKYPLTPANLSGKIGKEAIDSYLKSLNSLSPSSYSNLRSTRVELGEKMNQAAVLEYIYDSFKFALRIKKSSSMQTISFDKAIENLDIYAIPSWLRVFINPNSIKLMNKFGAEAFYQLNGGIPELMNTLKKIADSGSQNKFYKSLIEPLLGSRFSSQNLEAIFSKLSSIYGS